MGWADRAKKAAPATQQEPFLSVGLSQTEAIVLCELLGYLAGRNVQRTPWTEAQETAADVTVNRLAGQFDEMLQARGL